MGDFTLESVGDRVPGPGISGRALLIFSLPCGILQSCAHRSGPCLDPFSRHLSILLTLTQPVMTCLSSAALCFLHCQTDTNLHINLGRENLNRGIVSTRLTCEYVILSPASLWGYPDAGTGGDRAKFETGKSTVVPGLLSGYLGTSSVPLREGVRNWGPWSSFHPCARQEGESAAQDEQNPVWLKERAESIRGVGGEKSFLGSLRLDSLVGGLPLLQWLMKQLSETTLACSHCFI